METFKKLSLLALKISIGSSLAIYIAQSFHLQYPISAGTITLLTLLTSKWGTVKLSAFRLITFLITIVIGWFVFANIHSTWIAYGILVLIIVFVAELFGWRATISVNAVIGAHLVGHQEFSNAAIWNEFLLVLIGIVIAILLNLFHANDSHKKQIIANMRSAEHSLQLIVGELAAYLSNKDMQRNVWNDLSALEKQLKDDIREAYEYQDNTFHSHPEYYISYFEMRYEQCQVLHNLHYEMKRIRTMPKQAKVIAEYMIYLTDYVIEINSPEKQIEELHNVFVSMTKEELPKTREEFESRALLYHIMMDIEEFLSYKAKFVKNLDEEQLKTYWNKDPAEKESKEKESYKWFLNEWE